MNLLCLFHCKTVVIGSFATDQFGGYDARIETRQCRRCGEKSYWLYLKCRDEDYFSVTELDVREFEKYATA